MIGSYLAQAALWIGVGALAGWPVRKALQTERKPTRRSR